MALDFSDISQAPCSTPLRSAKEAEESISPSPSFFLRVLEGNPPIHFLSERFSHNHSQLTPVLGISFPHPLNVPKKRTQKCTQPAEQPQTPSRSSVKILLQDTFKYDFISRIRERPSKTLYPPSLCAGVESSLDTRRIVKGKDKPARALQSMSDWLAERKRTRNIPPKFRTMR